MSNLTCNKCKIDIGYVTLLVPVEDGGKLFEALTAAEIVEDDYDYTNEIHYVKHSKARLAIEVVSVSYGPREQDMPEADDDGLEVTT